MILFFSRLFELLPVVLLSIKLPHLFQSGPDISQFDDHWPVNLLAL